MKQLAIMFLTILLCSICFAAQADPQYRIAATTSGSVYHQITYAPDGTCVSMTEYESYMISDGYKVLKSIIRFDAEGNIVSVETDDPNHVAEVIGQHTWRSEYEGRTLTITYQDIFMEKDLVFGLGEGFTIHIVNQYDGAYHMQSTVQTVIQPDQEPLVSETVYEWVYDKHGCPIMQLDPNGTVQMSIIWEAYE